MNKIGLRLIFAAVVTQSILGCAAADRRVMTTFEPYIGPDQERQFKFFSKSDLAYPENTAEGEAVRKDWLKKWLSDNSYCENGYRIIERKAVSTGRFEAFKNIYYTGECT